MIQVENLTKDYGLRRAVDNISFKMKKGEVVGFLGPNGAGKTTTMRMLAGFMPPTSGDARIAGFHVVDDSLEVRRRVGYLPESVPLYTDMTVFDYLKFMADLNKVENAEDKVDEILEVVRLGDRAVSYIEKLSKGMRQRVGLAQALLHEPEVLILDEPTIGLDPGQIRGVRELIQDIGKKRTILLSTHILVEAQEICDRVLIMNNGKIVAEDTPENLEATLSGGSQIKLRVGGEAEKILSKLEKIKGVSNVKQSGEGAFELTTSADVDARPEIARAVVKANLDLLELRQVSMSLEDIFLEVTKNDGSSNDGGEE